VVDEEMLVARVRSEVFRDLAVPAGAVNIDAYEGCVTLRGQLGSESEIRRLVSAAKGIDGVRSVRSYLHLPDELPPNKAQMYEHSEQHLPSM
jgi:osmotically-inducible protein OsmY